MVYGLWPKSLIFINPNHTYWKLFSKIKPYPSLRAAAKWVNSPVITTGRDMYLDLLKHGQEACKPRWVLYYTPPFPCFFSGEKTSSAFIIMPFVQAWAMKANTLHWVKRAGRYGPRYGILSD